jgi:hypothetical protein
MKLVFLYPLVIVALLAGIFESAAQGTAFTYQGQLGAGPLPADGSYDLTFTLFNANTAGTVIAGPITNNAVSITNGLFTVTLDFGSGVWNGGTNWLEIGVETNGVHSFATLAPRQRVTPAPYAVFANTANNLLGALPAAQLTGTIPLAAANPAFVTNNDTRAFSLPGAAVGTANFANNAAAGSPLANQISTVAGFTNSGLSDSNIYIMSLTAPTAQMNAERLPWLGEQAISWFDITNLVTWFKTLPPNGYNVMQTIDQSYTNRVGGQLVFNSLNWNGLSALGFKNFLNTNGWRWQLWYDDNAAGHAPAGSPQQFILDMQTISSWRPDIAWIDATGTWEASVAQNIFATNSPSTLLMFGTSAPDLNGRVISMGNEWRLHCAADMVDWAEFVDYANNIEATGWQHVGPGQFLYCGPEMNWGPADVGGYTSLFSAEAANAMWSGAIIQGFGNTPNNQYGPWAVLTNQNLLAIDQDPAGICARRVLNMSNCWVYLKPLGTPAGPNFAVLVLNTNSATTSLTFNLSALNHGQQSGSYLLSPNYQVFDLKNNLTVSAGTNRIVVNSLVAYDYAWYRVSPPSVPVNAATLTGTLPAADLPGITTNVSTGGITFYITNGLIMRVSSP